jgi:deoxyribonuclease V
MIETLMTIKPLDIPDLKHELETLLMQIPEGRVTTFGDLARALGDVGASMWVAETIRGGKLAGECPIHRVVLKSGELTGESAADQKQRLKREGVTVAKQTVDLAEAGFRDFESSEPLAVLKAAQNRVPKKLKLTPYRKTPGEVAAVDLSYLDDGTAVACYALVETASGKLLWSDTVHREVMFPYISGYLAYRELPILLDLLEQVQSQRALADVVFVDGNGILHPRRAGIASNLGVLTNLRIVGVGKSLLCGKVDLSLITPDSPQPIRDGKKTIGMAMKAEPTSNPIFVSPGHRIDVPSAARLAKLLFHGHRIPEPIYHADALSRAKAKSLMSTSDKATDPLNLLPESP